MREERKRRGSWPVVVVVLAFVGHAERDDRNCSESRRHVLIDDGEYFSCLLISNADNFHLTASRNGALGLALWLSCVLAYSAAIKFLGLTERPTELLN